MSISTGILIVVAVFAVATLLAARAGIRSLQSARTVVFFRTRRARMLAGQQWLAVSVVLGALTFGTAMYGESLVDRLFSPVPISTATSTSLPLPTATPVRESTVIAATTRTTQAPLPSAASSGTVAPASQTSTVAVTASASSATSTQAVATTTANQTALSTSAAATARRQEFIAALSATPTATRTPVPTWTRTPTSTTRPTLTPSATRTVRPTFTSSVTSTFTFTPAPTFTPSRTSTVTVTRTLTPTQVASPTRTAPPTSTSTRTQTATSLPSPTSTPSVTATSTVTNTVMPTHTPSLTTIPTRTVTTAPSRTSTSTLIPTDTSVPTQAPTNTQVVTASASPTVIPSATRTPSRIPTQTPTRSTPSLTPTVSMTPTQNRGCDRIEFVTDLNVPRNSVFLPGSSFTKVWRLKNVGTCTWKTTYRVLWVGGDALSGQNMQPLPREVAPGQTIDLALNFKAPSLPGTYHSNWQIRNDKGEIFGTSVTANRPFSLTIRVETPAAPETAYNFALSACAAQWSSGAGNVRCPSVGTNANGFILRQPSSRLEDASPLLQPSFLTAPQDVFNGYISGVFPSFKVQQGDRLQAVIHCQYTSTACNVLFRIDYQLADGVVRDFWEATEQYDGEYTTVDIDLSSLANQEVRFVFTILSIGQASGDRAMWVEPRIVRNAPLITPTP